MQSKVEEIVESNLNEVESATEFVDAVRVLDSSIKEFLLKAVKEERGAFKAEILKAAFYLNEVHSAWKQAVSRGIGLTKGGEKEEEIQEALKVESLRVDEQITAIEKFFSLHDEKGLEEAALFYKSVLEPLGIKLVQKAKELEEATEEEMEELAKEIKEEVETFIFIGTALMLFIFIFSIALGYVLSKKLTKPIVYLKEAVGKISNKKFDVHIQNTSKDEIGDLTQAFNEMVRELDVAMKKEKKAVIEAQEAATLAKEKEKEIQKTYESLKRAQTQLVHNNRLVAIGELAAGVAHEINNPLTSVLGNAQLLLLILNSGKQVDFEKVKELCQAIEGSSSRCKEITSGLLSFSRREEREPEILDLNHIFKEALKLIQKQLEINNINVILQLSLEPVQVCVDRLQLQQVILNMISNAKDALETVAKEKQLILSTKVDREKKQVYAFFEDTGCGISEENKHKLFQPFFTTKDPGKGTGLGLSISYGIMKNFKGDIVVESQLGRGTKVTLVFPFLE